MALEELQPSKSEHLFYRNEPILIIKEAYDVSNPDYRGVYISMVGHDYGDYSTLVQVDEEMLDDRGLDGRGYVSPQFISKFVNSGQFSQVINYLIERMNNASPDK